jgi:hypothetical protein
MKLKIIKSKRLNDCVVELIEYKDDFGKIVNYSVVKAYQGKNVVGGGAAKNEEQIFSNEKEATNFFNNQN